MKICFKSSALVMGVLLLASVLRAQEAEGPTAIISAGDKAAIDANIDKPATVEGTVAKAAWSKSGKVMTITFKDTDTSHFTAVLFEKN